MKIALLVYNSITLGFLSAFLASRTDLESRHFSSASSGFEVRTVDVAVELQPSSAPQLPVLPAARPGELRDCYYNLHEQGSCSRLTANISQQECCCTMGEGWGLGCQYLTCPPEDTRETSRNWSILQSLLQVLQLMFLCFSRVSVPVPQRERVCDSGSLRLLRYRAAWGLWHPMLWSLFSDQ